MDRERRHREDEASEARQARAPQPNEPHGADAAILDLQATAGNRAVTELLAPSAGDTAVQRDTTNDTPTAEPMDATTSATRTMSIPDLKLSVPIQSIQMVAPRAGRGGTGDSSREQATTGEVVVTFGADDLSPALFAAVAQGQQFAVVTITLGSSTLTLRGVMISSAQKIGDSASVSLNFTSREFTPGAGG